VDPFDVLGIEPDASADDIARAYRREAKRWHPDRGGGAEQRMADVNAAYDLLRAEAQRAARGNGAGPGGAVNGHRRAKVPGDWLPAAVRRALGAELLAALDHREPVHLVTPTATWASPQALLAVTDRRLLWLLDDLPTARVRQLRFGAIAEVDHRLRPPRRRVAQLRVRTVGGKRHTFSELRPQTAAAIARLLAETR
jgi:hypothetical protein